MSHHLLVKRPAFDPASSHLAGMCGYALEVGSHA